MLKEGPLTPLREEMNVSKMSHSRSVDFDCYVNQAGMTTMTEDFSVLHTSSYANDQNVFRKSKSSSGSIAQLAATICIQSWVRGFLVRQRLSRLNVIRKSIRTIQAWIRGVQCRQRLAQKGYLVKTSQTTSRVFNRNMFKQCC